MNTLGVGDVGAQLRGRVSPPLLTVTARGRLRALPVPAAFGKHFPVRSNAYGYIRFMTNNAHASKTDMPRPAHSTGGGRCAGRCVARREWRGDGRDVCDGRRGGFGCTWYGHLAAASGRTSGAGSSCGAFRRSCGSADCRGDADHTSRDGLDTSPVRGDPVLRGEHSAGSGDWFVGGDWSVGCPGW